MKGLGKRMKVKSDLDLQRAKELKLKMQERIMELWNENGTSLGELYDNELIL
jgi:hypothetical protein